MIQPVGILVGGAVSGGTLVGDRVGRNVGDDDGDDVVGDGVGSFVGAQLTLPSHRIGQVPGATTSHTKAFGPIRHSGGSGVATHGSVGVLLGARDGSIVGIGGVGAFDGSPLGVLVGDSVGAAGHRPHSTAQSFASSSPSAMAVSQRGLTTEASSAPQYGLSTFPPD